MPEGGARGDDRGGAVEETDGVECENQVVRGVRANGAAGMLDRAEGAGGQHEREPRRIQLDDAVVDARHDHGVGFRQGRRVYAKTRCPGSCPCPWR